MSDDRFANLVRARLDLALRPFKKVRRRWGLVPMGKGNPSCLCLYLPGNPGGFDLLLGIRPGGVVVGSTRAGAAEEGWHSHAWERNRWANEKDLVDDLVSFVTLVLTPMARLSVLLCRGKPYRWRMEFREEEGWTVWEDVGKIFFWPLGRREEIRLQNDLIPLHPGGWRH